MPKYLLLISIFLCCVPAFAWSRTMEITVSVDHGIGILKASDLFFKDIYSKPAPQSIVVKPMVGDKKGIPAKFIISGSPGSIIECAITGPVVPLVYEAYSMNISEWRLGNGTDSGTSVFTPTLNSQGQIEVYVGAKLEVGVWQPEGLYTGQQVFTVVYQ